MPNMEMFFLLETNSISQWNCHLQAHHPPIGLKWIEHDEEKIELIWFIDPSLNILSEAIAFLFQIHSMWDRTVIPLCLQAALKRLAFFKLKFSNSFSV